MRIIEQAKAIIVKPKGAEKVQKVLDAIPSAREFQHTDGHTYVAIPHGLNETLRLRDLGLAVPAPILSYYTWKGQFKPYHHQKMTAAFLTTNKRALVLNEIGTGKTQSALWAADYLMEEGLIKKCLIVSPLSTLERVWGDAVFKTFGNRKAIVLYGGAEKRRQLLARDADFYIVNFDGFNIIARDAMNMFDLMIVDEAATLRNHNTKMSKAFRKWTDAHPNMRLWLMTGTPTPNAPTDAWALARMLGSSCLNSFYKFRDEVMQKAGPWKYVPRAQANALVQTILRPSIRYSRDDCLDLPTTVFQTHHAPLSAQQTQLYKEMLKNFTAQIANEGTINAVNEVSKLQKLVQISCGVAYSQDGKHIELDCAPRITLTKDLINQIGGKAIVFSPLLGPLHVLEKELSKYWTVATVTGATPASARDEIFADFQNAASPHIIIAHPQTMAHGLTLTEAQSVVWYGPITSNDQYVQANGRVERIGKKHVANVINIVSTKLEGQMFRRLQAKQQLQGVLLDYIEQQTTKGKSVI